MYSVLGNHKTMTHRYTVNVIHIYRGIIVFTQQQPSNLFLLLNINVQVILLYLALMSMSEIYMTLRGVLISCGNSLVSHVVMSQRVICGQADCDLSMLFDNVGVTTKL